MTATDVPRLRRYPGLKPFERSQSALFYGRTEDAQRLGNLILREQLVVLFAKSGIGKTSLLQAGVAPGLEKRGYIPIFIRADNTQAPILEAIRSSLEGHPNMGGFNKQGFQEGKSLTLWELMKRLEFDLDGLPVTPVLVFDQFEEVFTLGHKAASRQDFISALGDLVNESMPESVRSELLRRVAAGDKDLNASDMEWWEKEPELRIVISIRSDFLHLLDEVSPDIPGILRNRFQLQPLNRKQAQQAIEAPAASAGPYISKPFSYAPEALEEMLNFLSGEDAGATSDVVVSTRLREEIESFNLQILCQLIEEKIINNGEQEGFVVQPAFYGGTEGMRAEIQDFYQKQMDLFPELYEKRSGIKVVDRAELISTARKLVEESLVTPIGRRCSMVDDFLTTNWQVSPEFLDALVDTRLLRKELRLDDYYYEISHDTLLPAIIKSRDKNREKEKADQEKALLQQKLDEEAKRREAIEAELASVREKRRLARKVGILSSVSFFLALAFGIWFLFNLVKTIKGEFAQAERNFSNEIFDAAIPGFDSLAATPVKAFVLQRLGLDPAAQGRDAHRFNALFLATSNRMEMADSLFFQDEYAEALRFYHEATDSLRQYELINYAHIVNGTDTIWRINPSRIKDTKNALDLRLTSTMKTLLDQFKIRQRDAETFIEAEVWSQALRNLRVMEALLPEHADDVLHLQKELNLVGQTPAEYVAHQIRKCQARLHGGG
ncbi:MAG: hypothetical protein IPL65_07575 [Lewinellaceae bacterium]|nr:hypothetical protein [Lewinellaceae bacterium]